MGQVIAVGSKVVLRTVDVVDLEFLYRWENDPSVWMFGEEVQGLLADATTRSGVRPVPYSREMLTEFIENQALGFEANGQLRLMICLAGVPARNEAGGEVKVGMLDLFDHDHLARSAGVGILICDPADRCRGYAREALLLALDYARQALGLQRLTAVISTDNASSLALFRAAGFEPQQPLTPAAHKKTGAHPTGELLFEKRLIAQYNCRVPPKLPYQHPHQPAQIQTHNI